MSVITCVCREIGWLLCLVYFFARVLNVSLPPGDCIFAQLACPLNDVIFVRSGITNLYLQTLGDNHRHLSNIDCLRFVMCLLLAPGLPRLLFYAVINSANEANKAGGTHH
jgi:hypothetical protein